MCDAAARHAGRTAWRDCNVHPNTTIGSILIVTMLALAMLATTPRDSSQAASCPEGVSLPPVLIEVPANRAAVFGLADLVGAGHDIAGCLDLAAIDAASFELHAAEGDVTIVPASPGRIAGWRGAGIDAPGPRFQFTPQPGFNGVSRGWEFVLVGRDDDGDMVRAGVVRATFQVRNGVPEATDDLVTIGPRDGGTDVAARHGVLANDRDPNGDALVVHATGTTRFPWGAVEIHHDGSYRVTVTDPERAETVQVRYVVWDQQGSTAEADAGILTVAFADGKEAPEAHGAG